MDEENLEMLAEELTSCAVCTNKYFEKDEDGIMRVPKILDCTHTFCDKCIAHHLKECNSKRLTPVSNFPCPTCRKTIFVSPSGISAFPTDLKIRKIIELLHNVKTKGRPSSSVRNFCQNCQFKGNKEEGSFLCLTCQKIFCDVCRKSHQKVSLFKGHTFFNLSDQRATRGSTDSTSDACPRHPSNYLEYSCKTCNKSLCFACAMMPEHRNHDMTTLTGGSNEKMSENIYDEIRPAFDSTEPTDESFLKKQAIIAALKQRKDQLLAEVNFHDKSDSFKVCEEDMTRAYQEAKNALKNQYQGMLSKLKENKTSFDKITSKKEEIMATIKLVDKYLSEPDKNKKGPSDIEKADKYLKKLNAFDETTFIEADEYKLTFKPDVKVHLGELIKEDRENVASTLPPRNNVPLPRIAKKPKEEKNKRLSLISPTDNETSSKQAEKATNTVVADAFLKTLKSMLYKGQTKTPVPSRYAVQNDVWPGMLHWETKSLPNLRNICFAEQDEVLFVLDESCRDVANQLLGLRSSDGNPVVLVIDDSNEPLDSIKNMCYCNETKHFYLLGYREVQGMIKKFKLTSSKKNTNCTLKCIETIKLATIKDPIAMAVNKKTVAILESGGTKITVLNSKLEKISQTSDGDFSKSLYLTIDRNDKIIISDYLRREIKVFKNDEMVLKFSSTGPKGEELLPQGVVAATKQSNILVADQALNNISLYSCDGNLLEVIVENVVKPWGICFSEVKYLLAVATANGLKVYKL